MPQTPTYGLRSPALTDTPDVPRDLANLASDCDLALGNVVPVGGGLSLVTSLPPSPVTGQKVVLVDGPSRTWAWLCQYDAATPAPHRWLVLGGSELFVKVDASEWTTSASYAVLAGGPRLNLPYAGIWQLEVGAEVVPPTSGNGRVSLYVAGVAASDNDATSAQKSNAIGALTGNKRMAQRTIAAQGALVEAYYRATAGVQASFLKRYIRAMPVRIS